jgi:hypothetical protein
MADLRSDRSRPARTRSGAGEISWLRYVWISGAVAVGFVLVFYGLLVVAYSNVCDTDCGVPPL